MGRQAQGPVLTIDEALPTLTQETIEALLRFFFAAFIPDAASQYIVMNPYGLKAKYIHKEGPLTLQKVLASFQNETRKLTVKGRRRNIPLSLGVLTKQQDGLAKNSILDIDVGGLHTIQRVLQACEELGLWAFAQLSESGEKEGEGHSGGHVYIPCAGTLPAALLQDLAEALKKRTKVIGEAYPSNQRLRLPLMPHLRAPAGFRRFPLLLQNGQLIEVSNPFLALSKLREVWSPNPPEKITLLLQELAPTLQKTSSPKKKTRRHKSKVNPQNIQSVIGWFNDRFDTVDILHAFGTKISENDRVVTCPFHDDQSPSLSLFRHQDTGHIVCKCVSKHSGCEAAEVPYLDAFNLYCMYHSLTASQAVKRLAEEYGLGQKRTVKHEVKGTKESCPDAWSHHQTRLQEERERLNREMWQMLHQKGVIHNVKGIPGIGKTFAGACMASRLHKQRKRTTAVTPSHKVAQQWAEDLTRLGLEKDFVIWKSHKELCTCYEKDFLDKLSKRGYTAPPCKPKCPYQEQKRKAKEFAVVIFQHNHLYLNGGELLLGFDAILIDESPFSSLLQETKASQSQLLRLQDSLPSDDPGRPLLLAMYITAQKAREKNEELYAHTLFESLQKELSIPLKEAVRRAKTSTYARLTIQADPACDPNNMPKLFWGRLLEALSQDLEESEGNALLHWSRSDGDWRWLWHKQHTPLKAIWDKHELFQPSVVVLDGSANETICKKLYHPWPVKLVEFEVPLSPHVNIIQCPSLASTRRLIHDEKTFRQVQRSVAYIANYLDLLYDGGIAYKDIREHCEAIFEETWLHYGGQRGSNDLKGKQNVVLIASPTNPPGAIIRKAMALWSSEQALGLDSTREASGYYRYHDERLEAVNQLFGLEELRQALHRPRPILSDKPTNLIVCSPWPIQQLGFQPHQVISQLPHGNSIEMREAFQTYIKRKAEYEGGDKKVQGTKKHDFNRGVRVLQGENRPPPQNGEGGCIHPPPTSSPISYRRLKMDIFVPPSDKNAGTSKIYDTTPQKAPSGYQVEEKETPPIFSSNSSEGGEGKEDSFLVGGSSFVGPGRRREDKEGMLPEFERVPEEMGVMNGGKKFGGVGKGRARPVSIFGHEGAF